MNFDFPEIRIPWRRLLALCLALTICLSMLPAGALAAEEVAGAEEGAVSAQTETSEEASGEESEQDSAQPGAEASEPENTLPDEAEEPASAQPEEPASDEGESAASGAEEEKAPETEGGVLGLETQSVPTSGVCGEDLTWTLKSGTLTVSGSGGMWDWYTESTPWVESRNVITSVVLEEGVTSVGAQAFEDCVNLSSVTLPEGLTGIGEQAFVDCTGLSSAVIPASVVSIGEGAFQLSSSYDEDTQRYLTALNNLTISGYAGSYAHSYATEWSIPFQSLGEPDFGNENVYFGDVTGNATRVSGLVKPLALNGSDNALVKIGRTSAYYSVVPETTGVYRFTASGKSGIFLYRVEEGRAPERLARGNGTLNCELEAGTTYWVRVRCSGTGTLVVDLREGISSGSLGTSWQRINGKWTKCEAKWRFQDGTLTVSGTGSVRRRGEWGKLKQFVTRVVFEEGITDVEADCLFAGARALKSVSIPSTMTGLGSRTFADTSLESLTLPEGVSSIGEGCFAHCEYLRSAKFPASLTQIGERAFNGCIALESVTLKEGTVKIRAMAFYGCESLKNLSVPASVTRIESRALGYHWSATEYEDVLNGGFTLSGYTGSAANTYATGAGIPFVPLDDPDFGSGNVYFGDVTGNATRVSTLVQPLALNGSHQAQVKLSRTSAYYAISPETTGVYRFSASDNARIYLYRYAANAAPERIAKGYGTLNCALQSGTTYWVRVLLPKGAVGTVSVSLNDGDTSGTLSNGIRWRYANGTLTFSGSGPVAEKGRWGKLTKSITSAVFEEGITGVTVDGLFSGATHLETVTLPSTMKSLGRKTFCRTALRSVSIPEGVKSIDYLTFYGCQSLKSVTIPTGVKTIGSYAFFGCSALNSVELPAGVRDIYSRAFYGCTALSSVSIPAGVKNIDYRAFYGCTRLGEVTVPDSVTWIDEEAFGYYRNGDGNTCCSENFAISGCTRSAAYYYALQNGITFTSLGQSASPRGPDLENNRPLALNQDEAVEITAEQRTVTFRFTPDRDGDYVFTSFDSVGCDPYAVLYNERGWELEKNDDGDNMLLQFQLRRYLEAGETYYLMAKCKSSKETGSYQLKASIYQESAYGALDWTLKNDTLTITGSGTMPDYGWGDAPWYQDRSKIRSIVIGEGVKSIGRYAFTYCTNLSSVSIPEGVKSIGYGAFEECSALERVSIPASVETIGGYAFGWCERLTEVNFAGEEPLYPDSAFQSTPWRTTHGFDQARDMTMGESYPVMLTKLRAETIFRFTPAASRMYELSMTGEAVKDASFSIWKGTNNCIWSSGKLAHIELEEGTTYYIKCTGSRKYCDGSFSVQEYNAPTSGSCGENLSWTLSENGTLTISGSGEMAYSNPAPWVDSREKIRSIVIGLGVTGISKRAFEDCTNATSVSIPQSVKSIGKYAFDNCQSLEAVTIPGSVESIGYRAFADCNGLTSLTITNGVKSIPKNGFENCRSLKTLSIPGSVENIGYRAFYNCSALNELTISNGVKAIGRYAFRNCYSLESVSIPGSVVIIKTSAFGDCYRLSSLTLSEGLATIKGSAFQYNDSLESVRIPESVTSIEGYAFAYCDRLTTVSFANPEMEYPDTAFEDTPWQRNRCYEQAQAMELGRKYPVEFDSLHRYTVLKFTPKASRWYEFAVSDENNTETILELRDSAGGCIWSGSKQAHLKLEKGKTCYLWCRYRYSLDEGSSYCVSVQEYDCPTSGQCGESVTWTLNGQGKLTISGTGRMEDFKSIDEVPWYESSAEILSVDIQDGVTRIGERSFQHCNNLASASIPGSVENIGYMAFSYCESLYDVTIPQGVKTISKYAFEQCRSLECLVIPSSVRTIKYAAFRRCGKLSTLKIYNGVTTIGDEAFCDNNSLESVTIPKSVTSLGRNAFANCNRLKTVRFSGTAPATPDDAFWDTPWWRSERCRTAPVLALGQENQMDLVSGELRVFYRIEPEESGLYTFTLPQINRGYADITLWTSPEDRYDRVRDQSQFALTRGTTYYLDVQVQPYSHEGYSYAIRLDKENVELNNTFGTDNKLTWARRNDVLFIGGQGVIPAFENATYPPWGSDTGDITAILIEEGVTGIAQNAFRNYWNLNSVSIPSTVETIGDSAFTNSTRLMTVSFAGEIPSDSILESPFRDTAWYLSRHFTYDAPELLPGVKTTANFGPGKHFCYYRFIPDKTALYEVTITDLVGMSPMRYGYYVDLWSGPMERLADGRDNARTLMEAGHTYYIRCNGTHDDGANLNCSLSVCMNEYIPSPECGEYLTWTLEDGTMTISGTGAMDSYNTWSNCPPWNELRSQIRTIVVESGVKSIGDYAFYDCYNLKNVTIPDSVKSIGNNAFASYNNLTISGYIGSAAETYADRNAIPFVALDEPQIETAEEGDFTGDADVTMADVTLGNQVVVGIIRLTKEQKKAADVTGDGDYTMADVVWTNGYVIGKHQTRVKAEN